MATATYTPIATQTLGSAAASITFSSIPGTYTDLRLVLTCTSSSANSDILLTFNGDTATNYSRTYLVGLGSSAISGSPTSQNNIPLDGWGASTTVPQMYSVDIFSYAGSTNKTLLCSASEDDNGSGRVTIEVGLWRNTSAITSITLGSTGVITFSTGTIATLWGI